MALHPLRLRRALSVSLSVLRSSRQAPRPISCGLLSGPSRIPTPTHTPTLSSLQTTTRFFTSTTSLLRKTFDSEAEEIRPDTILFEGCDYNHWLITIDFPKDSNLTRDQMIDTYVNTAAQVFGSVEEAKKKIYALSTTTYQGFQVECSEETSEKFKSLPGVVFVLPDSYIDPVNKEYGGDKYVNGEIFPRPPPVHYGRRSNRDNRPREQNYGPPPQQNYGQGSPPRQHYGQGSPPQQNYGQGPPPQQNYGQGSRPQQNYGPPPQQNYGPPPQQNFEQPLRENYAPQQGYAPPPQQGYAPPPQQGYAPPPQQGYAPPPQLGSAPRPNQSYGQPPPPSFGQNTQQSYGNSPNFPPQQNFSPAGLGEGKPMSSYQGNFSQPEPRNHFAQGQGNLQSPVPPEQRGSLQDVDYRSSQGGTFERVSGGQGNFSSIRNN
ncbi:hypothetical protein ACS0TY_035674 [Phlomoides rotata]